MYTGHNSNAVRCPGQCGPPHYVGQPKWARQATGRWPRQLWSYHGNKCLLSGSSNKTGRGRENSYWLFLWNPIICILWCQAFVDLGVKYLHSHTLPFTLVRPSAHHCVVEGSLRLNNLFWNCAAKKLGVPVQLDNLLGQRSFPRVAHGTVAHDTRRVKRKEVDLDTTLDKQLSQTFKGKNKTDKQLLQKSTLKYMDIYLCEQPVIRSNSSVSEGLSSTGSRSGVIGLFSQRTLLQEKLYLFYSNPGLARFSDTTVRGCCKKNLEKKSGRWPLSPRWIVGTQWLASPRTVDGFPAPGSGSGQIFKRAQLGDSPIHDVIIIPYGHGEWRVHNHYWHYHDKSTLDNFIEKPTGQWIAWY